MSYTHCQRCGDEFANPVTMPMPLCPRCATIQRQNAPVPGLTPLQMLFEQVRSLIDLSETYSVSESIVDTQDLEELYETVQRMVEQEGN